MTLLEQQLHSLLEQHKLSDVLHALGDEIFEPLHGIASPDSVEKSYMSVGQGLRALAEQMHRIEADRP